MNVYFWIHVYMCVFIQVYEYKLNVYFTIYINVGNFSRPWSLVSVKIHNVLCWCILILSKALLLWLEESMKEIKIELYRCILCSVAKHSKTNSNDGKLIYTLYGRKPPIMCFSLIDNYWTITPHFLSIWKTNDVDSLAVSPNRCYPK